MTGTTHTGLRPADRDAFLQAMRRVANSVAVVTTDGAAGCHGATVSAFASVSADPPMILVCLRSGSRIAQAVASNRALCVNVLAENRPDLANRFAGRHDRLIDDRFEGISVVRAPGAAPEIEGATRFAGVVGQTVAARSHSVFICRVACVGTGAQAPLTYLDGAYRRISSCIAAPDGAAVRG